MFRQGRLARGCAGYPWSPSYGVHGLGLGSIKHGIAPVIAEQLLSDASLDTTPSSSPVSPKPETYICTSSHAIYATTEQGRVVAGGL